VEENMKARFWPGQKVVVDGKHKTIEAFETAFSARLNDGSVIEMGGNKMMTYGEWIDSENYRENCKSAAVL